MKGTVRWAGDVKFVAESGSGHSIVIDGPPDYGGKNQGVRPRVFFGERWITSIFDLFEENVRYFPALLPVREDEDPLEELEAGRTPSLAELRLHNGTIYRWNRPVYDVVRRGSGKQEVATTMAFVRLLKDLMKDKGMGDSLKKLGQSRSNLNPAVQKFFIRLLSQEGGALPASVQRKILQSMKKAQSAMSPGSP